MKTEKRTFRVEFTYKMDAEKIVSVSNERDEVRAVLRGVSPDVSRFKLTEVKK